MKTILVTVALVLTANMATAQTLPQAAPGQTPAFTDCKTRPFKVTSSGQSDVGKDKVQLYRGNVILECDDTTIYADEIEWSDADQIVHARGHVTFEQPRLRITASRIELNRQTRYGLFFDADGTAQISARAREPRSLYGTMEPEVHFWASRLERIGDQRYRIDQGGFTTCIQPTERWSFVGRNLTVEIDEYILLRHAVFRVKGVPLFYLPMLYYPLGEDDRSTGFLLPTYTSSAALGTGLSNAFFWAINRSQDATLYHTWYSRAGQSIGGEYRYTSAPGSDGRLTLNLVNTPATDTSQASRQFDLRGHINQALPRGFRLVGTTNYFSSLRTQQTYEQNLIDISQRQRGFAMSVTGNVGRLRIDAAAEQNDFFVDLDSARRGGRLPSVTVQLPDRPIGRSRVYVGAVGNVSSFVLQEDISRPETDLGNVRFDLRPTISAPLSTLSFLSVNASAAWRVTQWLRSRDPESETPSAPIDRPIGRQLFELSADVRGPTLNRVFQTPNNGYAERFKHLIEPRITVRYYSPFDRGEEILRSSTVDSIDSLVGGTASVAYSLTNRILARVRQPGGTSEVREILTVSLGQTYFTNALAAAADPNQYIQTIYPFSALSLDVTASPTDGARYQFTTLFDAKYRRPQTFAARATLQRSLMQLSAHWSKRQFIPGSLDFPEAFTSHAVGAALALSERDGRLTGRYEFDYDLKLGGFVAQRILVGYNTQCCGIAVDYKSIKGSAASLIPPNRVVNLMFTLAGIGSFANPLGAFGNNTGR